jgi:mono/diheme cytochrome c family protein
LRWLPHRRAEFCRRFSAGRRAELSRIANKTGQTAQSIAGAIVVPHPPMPQIQLTREEIGDVAAYILTLKDYERGTR